MNRPLAWLAFVLVLVALAGCAGSLNPTAALASVTLRLPDQREDVELERRALVRDVGGRLAVGQQLLAGRGEPVGPEGIAAGGQAQGDARVADRQAIRKTQRRA